MPSALSWQPYVVTILTYFSDESSALRDVNTLAPYHTAGLGVVRAEGSTPNDPVPKPVLSLLHPWSSGWTRSLEEKSREGWVGEEPFHGGFALSLVGGVSNCRPTLSLQGFTLPLSELGGILTCGGKSHLLK